MHNEDDRTEKAMKDMQPTVVTGYYEITDFFKEHTQMWDKSVDEVMHMIYEWTWIEMTTATRDRDELAKRTLAIVVDALRHKKDDMTFDDMIAQLESKTEEVRRLKELSGIKEADRSDVTHAQLVPHIKNVKAAMIRHAQEDPSEANEFIEHLDDMMQVGDVEVVDMMQPDWMDTEARDSLISYFEVSISQDPALYNMIFPGEDIKWAQGEYKDMFESPNNAPIEEAKPAYYKQPIMSLEQLKKSCVRISTDTRMGPSTKAENIARMFAEYEQVMAGATQQPTEEI